MKNNLEVNKSAAQKVDTTTAEVVTQLDAAAPKNTGAMIAFFLPAEFAVPYAGFANDAGPNTEAPGDLHITLAYFGEASAIADSKDIIVETLRTFAATHGSITGSINGIGRFNSDGSQDPLYASFDAPMLPAFRQALVDALAGAGVTVDATHGFTPHITLAYLEPGTPMPDIPLPPSTVTFDAITLAWGDERLSIPLGQVTKTLTPEVLATLVELASQAGRDGGHVMDDGEILDFVRASANRLGLVEGEDEIDTQAVQSEIARLNSAGKSIALYDPEDHLIAIGSAVKALGDGRVGGYLVVFTDPSRKDLGGDYFTRETDYCLDWYPIRPALYQHALDGTIKTAKLGDLTVKMDDVGIWAEAQLNLADMYIRAVYRMVEAKKLGWSSGSVEHLAKKLADGRIVRWPIIEGSLTPTPAFPPIYPQTTRVTTLKAYLADLEGPSAKAEDAGQDAGSVTTETKAASLPESELMDPTTMMALVQAVVEALGIQMSQDEMSQLVQRATPLYEQYKQTQAATASAAAPALTEAQMAQKAVTSPEFLQAIAQLAQTAKAEKDAAAAAVKSAVAATIKAAPGISRVDGGFTFNGGSAGARIEDVRDMRFDDLSASDMIFGAHILKSAVNLMAKPASEAYLQAAAYKILRLAEKGDKVYDFRPIKSALPFKADEILATNLSSYGADWVGTAFERQLWERIRMMTIYQELLSRGMLQVQVGQGDNNFYIPVEGAGATWYSLAELNDEDATERPPIVAKSSKPALTRKQGTLGFIGARVEFTDIQDEDSLIPMLPFLRDSLEKDAQEQIEYVIFNADSATGASTNINLIDGTPSVDAKGRGPVYLAGNGILKLALVTATALSRDCGGTFDEDDFANTTKLLAAPMRQDRTKLMYVMDSDTAQSATQIPTVKTRDVFSGATLEEGVLTSIFKIKVYESGQIALANSAGKIPAAGGTLGRLACVRPDRFVIGWKRQVRTESARDIDSQATVVVCTLRFGIANRENNGVAVSYNVPVS